MAKQNFSKSLDKFFKSTARDDSMIRELVREPTAGGIVYRVVDNKIEILLIQDSRNRWTIPKGHFESGETARQTAGREVKEETGLAEITVKDYLGKIHFRFRRTNTLVLMTTHIFLVKAEGDTTTLTEEYWMHDLKWVSIDEAFDIIAYEAIIKLLLKAVSHIKEVR